jgi:putative ABC transport system ATP-binding protein
VRPSSSLIDLINIKKSYWLDKQEVPVLHDICLQVHAGEMLAIVGPSGSGKSTLMNLIGLLDRPSAGQYFLQNQEVSQVADDELARLRNQQIGFVFQQFFLLPRLSAADNVALPLTYRDLSPEVRERQVIAMLDKVGMRDRAAHHPNALSGGQQQRVAIARALVGNPSLILADEPTGSLDSKTGQEVLELFKSLHREEGRTVIIVTHDLQVAEQCQRIIKVSDGAITHDLT